MKRVNFFSGQIVQREDLEYMQNAINDEIKSRTASQYSKGVISKVSAYVSVDLGQTIKISPFNAYTESGEQIVIPSEIRQLALDLTDDTNRQLGTQGFLKDEDFGWRPNEPLLIVARYTEEAARPRPHFRTRKPYATRVYSGFKFFAMREGIDPLEENGVNPYIVLARALFVDGKLIVTTSGITEYAGLDSTRVNVVIGDNINRDYNISSTVTVDQHVRSIGDITKVTSQNPHGLTAEILGLDSNAVPEHEKVFHAEGFIGEPNSVNSCFYTRVNYLNINVDQLVISNLKPGNNLHYGGITLKSYSYPSDTIFISLSDDFGIWPDGTYTTFIDMKSGNIGVASSSTTVVQNRKYSIFYNQNEQQIVSPISLASLDTSYQYVLYTYEFKQEKDYTLIDLGGQGKNLSNFISQVDHRSFGSVSGNNLQRNSDGDFVLNFPIKTTAVKFSDNTILTSANAYTPNYIDKSLRISYDTNQTIRVGYGVCKDSTNTVVMNLSSEITKSIFIDWSKGTNRGCKSPLLSKSEGTWHVFLISTLDGITDIGIDTSIDASNLVNGNLKEESPIPNYRYYRRIGSIYVVKDGDTFLLKEFVTLPDSGNGVTTIYTYNEDTSKQYIKVSGNKTILPVPSMYVDGKVKKYSYITVKMSVESRDAGTYIREFLPKSQIEILGSDGLSNLRRALPVGEIDFNTFNGCVNISSNNWTGKVISYYDPRII